ncbi:hypothetical protein VTK73DRAFT_4380 [Phialemonium thermophilum]|uniref:Autophagy-related protein 9 n=1 Tax=Phialemonium thermophilum TaxID=223376 RepID=A0ABR3XZC3_9PEZI
MFSKLLSSRLGRSFYDEARATVDNPDIESEAGLLDAENLNHQFYDDDLEHAEGLTQDDSRLSHLPSSGPTIKDDRRGRPIHSFASPRWLAHVDDGDDDVPASLLVEPHDISHSPPSGRRRKLSGQSHQPSSLDESSARKPRFQWEGATARHGLHDEDGMLAFQSRSVEPRGFMTSVIPGNAKQKAEWRWANVSNLDNFIKDVYDYYHGYGIWCILLERCLHLLNVAFVAVFLTFLTQCIDFGKVRDSKTLSQILIPQCTKKMSLLWNVGLYLFSFYFVYKSIQYILDLRRLLNVRDFYVHLLNIPDEDMQTVTWQDVVARVMSLRDKNPKTARHLSRAQQRWIGSQSKERLDASDIANRLMRRENYMIALFNKEILDLKLPLPFVGSKELFSRTLEWTLVFSILDFIFDNQGQVNQEFLKSDRRAELSAKLRSRFIFSGIMNLIFAPFLAAYLLIVYFLTYYQEYQKNPSAIAARTYTPLAEWKFREFNELPHLFRKRLNMSHPYASHYIDQFPRVKTEMLLRTVAFMAGAIVTVLAIVSLLDPELFLNFEITHDRTVLFYVGILTAIWVFAHGSISEETTVFDPEFALRNVIEYTHYEPDHWKGRLHTYDVKREFSELYKMKIVIFLEEVLSILVTPLLLLFSLPKSSEQIIDFFREFTIHVDGLGYVCSFAEFDFKKGLPTVRNDIEQADVRNDYYSTKHGKMEASYYGFIGNYGNYMLNQKTGIPGPVTPGIRSQFYPPLAPAVDLAGARGSRTDHARNGHAPTKTPRPRAAVPSSSPVASILLDPHHQPVTSKFGNKSGQRARHVSVRGEFNAAEGGITEESGEDGPCGNMHDKQPGDEDVYESGGVLDESAWQVSPTKTLSRENSTTAHEEPVAGVVGMIYQFNQAQLNRRPGIR